MHDTVASDILVSRDHAAMDTLPENAQYVNSKDAIYCIHDCLHWRDAQPDRLSHARLHTWPPVWTFRRPLHIVIKCQIKRQRNTNKCQESCNDDVPCCAECPAEHNAMVMPIQRSIIHDPEKHCNTWYLTHPVTGYQRESTTTKIVDSSRLGVFGLAFSSHRERLWN